MANTGVTVMKPSGRCVPISASGRAARAASPPFTEIRTRRQRHDSGDRSEQRRLPGSVAPQQVGDLPGGGCQGDLAQNLAATQAHTDAVDEDSRRAARGHRLQ